MRFRWTPPIPGPHAVARLEQIDINGSRQAVLIRGENRQNPILLWLHGGPGSAQIGIARRYTKALEREFLVVNWDQRGSGLSYTPRIPREQMTTEQFVEDAHALIQWLLREFGQERLFLVGHSWGSILGALVAGRYPHLLHAYIGTGQVVNMVENEAISYQFTLEAARRCGNHRAIRQLERMGPPPYPRGIKDLGIQRMWLSRLGGSTHTKGTMLRLLLNVLRSTEYRLPDLIGWVRGNMDSLKHLWDQLQTTDLRREVPALQTPVYFLLGRYDYQTPFELATAYLEQLEAPSKELIWFEQSGHMPIFEEPDRFQQAILEILDRHRAADRAAAPTA